jgi:hypothetical protein
LRPVRFLYLVYAVENAKWVLLDIVDSKTDLVTKIDALNFTTNASLLVIVPKLSFNTPHLSILIDQHEALPSPDSKKIDVAPLADRAILRIQSTVGCGFSSYSSEYPEAMTNKYGSMFCTTSILSSNTSHKILLLININKISVKKSTKLMIYDDNCNRILESHNIHSNSCNIINLHSSNDLKDNFISSNELGGIPIFLEFYDHNHISIEHSHPPTEYFISTNRFKNSTELKSHWFKKIYTSI